MIFLTTVYVIETFRIFVFAIKKARYRAGLFSNVGGAFYSSFNIPLSCSLDSGVFGCPCTAVACAIAASSTSSSVPDNFNEQFASLGCSLQSMNFRPVCVAGVAIMLYLRVVDLRAALYHHAATFSGKAWFEACHAAI